MKLRDLVTGALLGVGLAALSFTVAARAADGSRDEEAIRAIEHKVVVAKTADEVMQYCDKDIVLYDVVTPLRYVGYKAVRDHMEAVYYSKEPKDIKVDFLSLKVLADGNLGVAYSIQHFTWKESGQSRELTVRQTDVYRKLGGEWKVIQSHISVPVDSKTGSSPDELAPIGQLSVSRILWRIRIE